MIATAIVSEEGIETEKGTDSVTVTVTVTATVFAEGREIVKEGESGNKEKKTMVCLI